MRSIAFFMYFFGYLIYSVPFLNKARKYTNDSETIEQQDMKKQVMAKKWASTLVKISGADITVKGEENIPAGSVLMVSNHEGNFDIPVLIGFLKKPFGFISKVEVEKIPIVYKWMEVMNCVLMDRKDRRQSIKAIRQGISLIKEGHSIVVFPEGTRSKGGPVAEFKAGSLRLGMDAQAPIVPIAIKGTSKLMEKNKGWIKPGKVTVSILPAITYEQYKDMKINDLAIEIQKRIQVERESLL
ncbi:MULTISPECIES: lysophospholipid acyltransferase family protein [Bacillus]|uniref:lysophospholipid acyltransferase family protein n=1 Tax=Bacillus TaxID=1386 RepID=UPI00030B89F2|nr:MULTISPECIES: lysophospholipid acyltransferase family protein [Bacillus]